MNQHRWLLTGLLALLASTAPVSADEQDEVVPGQVVVRLQPGASVSGFLTRYGLTTLDDVASRDIWLLSVPEGDEEEMSDIFAVDPDVVWAEPNYTGKDLDPDPDTQSIFVSGNPQAYQDQPAISLTRLDRAHRLADGSGVLVAVLDSGIDADHPWLAGSLAPGAWNFIDDNADVRDIGDGVDSNDNGQTDEMVGHGTLAAGLIVRAAPGAQVLPLKVLDSDGLTNTFTLVQAIAYAVDQGAMIVNISMGTTVDTQILHDAVLEASAAQVVIVASVGNENTNSPVRFPAAYSDLGVIAVASTDAQDHRSEFSNFGQHVTLCAPGTVITSTVPGGGFGRASGTSFSAPLVAGTAALVVDRYGTSDPRVVRRLLTISATNIEGRNPGYEGLLGHGRLNAFHALLSVTGSQVRRAGGAPASTQPHQP